MSTSVGLRRTSTRFTNSRFGSNGIGCFLIFESRHLPRVSAGQPTSTYAADSTDRHDNRCDFHNFYEHEDRYDPDKFYGHDDPH